VGPDEMKLRTVSGTIHPNYNDETYDYDFMVLKLEIPAERVPTISLNDQSGQPVPHDQVQVVGLGLTSEGGEFRRC
jgi:Trypsin